MKFSIKNPNTDWHLWFAWHPVMIPIKGSIVFVWLGWVYRRWDKTPEDIPECWCWDYSVYEVVQTRDK